MGSKKEGNSIIKGAILGAEAGHFDHYYFGTIFQSIGLSVKTKCRND